VYDLYKNTGAIYHAESPEAMNPDKFAWTRERGCLMNQLL